MRKARLALGLVAVTSIATSLVNPVAASAQSVDSGSSTSSASSTGSSSADSSQPSAEEGSAGSSGSSSGAGTPLSSVGHTSTENLSDECAAEVIAARKQHEENIAKGQAGSSFMGPQELALGIVNGYGSSGMPKEPDCIDAEKKAAEDARWEKMPAALQSMRGNETTQLIFEVLSILLALGSGLTTLAQAYVAFVPGGREDARAFLRNAGFRF
ncbi:MAG: hypothetical protein SOW59_05770 [Corynebacterium sp.]|nr:hypothetical protein [Corynebacterium sp.]